MALRRAEPEPQSLPSWLARPEEEPVPVKRAEEAMGEAEAEPVLMALSVSCAEELQLCCPPLALLLALAGALEAVAPREAELFTEAEARRADALRLLLPRAETVPRAAEAEPVGLTLLMLELEARLLREGEAVLEAELEPDTVPEAERLAPACQPVPEMVALLLLLPLLHWLGSLLPAGLLEGLPEAETLRLPERLPEAEAVALGL